MTARTLLLSDEEITTQASCGCNFCHDWERGAYHARSIYEARLAEDAKVRAQLVEALKKTRNVLIHHRIDGHTNPLCGWDFAATLANIDAALAAAKERG